MADLSSEKLSTADQEFVNLGIAESAHRIGTQKSVLNAALALSTVLFMAAIFMALCMLYLIANNPQIHWHSSILVAALTIPPTVVMVAVLRAVFRVAQKDQEKPEKEESTSWPTQEVAKELISAVREAATK